MSRRKTAEHGERRSKQKKPVELLPPTADAARDEGPRLIPLGDRSKEPSRLEHYLDLADTALGVRKPKRSSESESSE
jgi:hypothetical protein